MRGSYWPSGVTMLLAGLVSATTHAQDVPRIEVDRIAAVVGDTPIPMSRIDEQINAFRAAGGEVPTDPEGLMALRRQLLERIIGDELLVQAAERDTMVRVTDEEIQSAVEEQLQNIRNSVPSQLDLERELRSAGFKSLDEYRVWLGEQQRRQLLQTTYLQELQRRGDYAPLEPTDEELLQYYEENRQQFGERPATVSFRQIAVAAQPDSAALRTAFLRADSVRQRIANGGDFEALAREYSDDPGTKDRGGNLGWFRRGQGMVREFEDAAFRLRPGALSSPVYSPFGFHIIEVLRAEPASVQARHILIAPKIDDEDRAAARVRADSALALMRAGVSFDSLVRRFHDRTEERVLDAAIRENLPAPYQEVLANAQPGDLLGPVEFDRGGGRTVYVVIRFVGARPAGEATFEDVRDQIRPRLAEQNAINRLIQSLRKATYVEIRL